jgi:hypothetical protein
MQQRIENYPPAVEEYRKHLLPLRDKFEEEGRMEFRQRYHRAPRITARERDAILQRTLANVRPLIDELCDLQRRFATPGIIEV